MCFSGLGGLGVSVDRMMCTVSMDWMVMDVSVALACGLMCFSRLHVRSVSMNWVIPGISLGWVLIDRMVCGISTDWMACVIFFENRYLKNAT